MSYTPSPYDPNAIRTYEAFFMGKRATIQAKGLAEAKQKALDLFKPSKAKSGLVAVVLADQPISTGAL